MKNDILYESLSTASNRYYDSKSSIQSSPVEVVRPAIEIQVAADEYSHRDIEVCETVIHRGCDIVKI